MGELNGRHTFYSCHMGSAVFPSFLGAICGGWAGLWLLSGVEGTIFSFSLCLFCCRFRLSENQKSISEFSGGLGPYRPPYDANWSIEVYDGLIIWRRWHWLVPEYSS